MIKNLVTVKVGSHLYGLARPSSDIDLYTVYDFTHKNYRPNRQVGQIIDEEVDSVKISWDKFREFVFKGVPQALEVLFSDSTFWLDWREEWIKKTNSLQEEIDMHIPDILDTYRRTIMNFFAEEDFKKNRHGFRLLLNAGELKTEGWFDPTLAGIQKEYINGKAELPWSERQEEYKNWLWDVFGGDNEHRNAF